MDEFTALAAQQLERVKVTCSQIGLKYVELPPWFMGLGIAIGFGETDYTVLSILGGGSESQLMTTSGILKNINQDRGAALHAVNRFNQQNSSYTVYLHDAEPAGRCWCSERRRSRCSSTPRATSTHWCADCRWRCRRCVSRSPRRPPSAASRGAGTRRTTTTC